ncbi:MAG TPA: molybdopterin-dependent oxidoreductase [Candidatus Paceibacterota bacterium]|nr:molybdopterin-dependent oxidoreductase [Candidatus Paceibacterota bacterium]
MAQASSNSSEKAKAVDCILVTVDGRRVEVPRLSRHPTTGAMIPTTMIQACEIAGTLVPHYCYHPRLPVAGSCRMCLVEFGTPALGPDRKPLLNSDGTPQIRKSPRPAIACATPVSPGMEIYTQTPSVLEMRRGVLEFLLINHPLDCPICDQAGECKLQEYSLEHGQASSRFVENKVRKPKQVDLGPRIMLDDERCILCSRCIRFTRDIVGDDALGFVNRGSYTALTHYPGKPFDNNYTLNTVDICPVGALTSKDFRFQMRVWFLKETRSLCASCGTGCNIVIGSRQSQIFRYTPRENADVNRCWMCDAGRLNYKWIGRADRLRDVRVRTASGASEPATWKQALASIATTLKTAVPGSVAIIGSARQTNEELSLLSRLAQHLGALTDSVPRQGEADHLLVNADRNPNSMGAVLTGMAARPMGARLFQIGNAIDRGEVRTLVVFGEDITRFIPEAHLRRLELLVVGDVLPNSTTVLAQVLLPGCAHAEKRGSFTNARGRVQRFFKAVEPPGDARPESEFLGELVAAVTGREYPADAEGLFNRMTAELASFKGLSWAGLGETGQVLPGGVDHV